MEVYKPFQEDGPTVLVLSWLLNYMVDKHENQGSQGVFLAKRILASAFGVEVCQRQGSDSLWQWNVLVSDSESPRAHSDFEVNDMSNRWLIMSWGKVYPDCC